MITIPCHGFHDNDRRTYLPPGTLLLPHLSQRLNPSSINLLIRQPSRRLRLRRCGRAVKRVDLRLLDVLVFARSALIVGVTVWVLADAYKISRSA